MQVSPWLFQLGLGRNREEEKNHLQNGCEYPQRSKKPTTWRSHQVDMSKDVTLSYGFSLSRKHHEDVWLIGNQRGILRTKMYCYEESFLHHRVSFGLIKICPYSRSTNGESDWRYPRILELAVYFKRDSTMINGCDHLSCVQRDAMVLSLMNPDSHKSGRR